MAIIKHLQFDRPYVLGSLLIKCDCQGEIMEVLQYSTDDKRIQYEFTYYEPFGSSANDDTPGRFCTKNMNGSVFGTDKEGIKKIIEFFTNPPALPSIEEAHDYKEASESIIDPATKFELYAQYDNCGMAGFAVYTDEGEELWEIMIKQKELKKLIAHLSALIENDNEETIHG